MEAGVRQQLKPVRVRVRQLDYVTTGINPMGDEVDVIKTAYGPGAPQLDPAGKEGLEIGSQEHANLVSDFQNGQMILLRPFQYNGLITSGAVRDVQVDESGEEVNEDEELLNIGTASADDLAEWIRSEHPTVNDVVQASEGQPDLARKLLEAERDATGGEPRKGVIEGLSAVISRG